MGCGGSDVRSSCRKKKFQTTRRLPACGRAPRDEILGFLGQTNRGQTSMRKLPIGVLERGFGAGSAQNAPTFYHIRSKMSIGNFAQKKHRIFGISTKNPVNCHTIPYFFFGLCSIKSILNTFPPIST